MKRDICEQMLSGIDEFYIEEAIGAFRRKSSRLVRSLEWVGKMTACLILVCSILMGTLTISAACGSLSAYEALSALSPDFADRFAPVNVSCDDKGIRMTVDAIYVQGDTAEIYVSLQDLEGDRIDGTTDLFDSYSIHSNCDQVSGCSLVGFDEETGKATFLISIEQLGQRIGKARMKFSVSQFLSQKTETEVELTEQVFYGLPMARQVRQGKEIGNLRGYGILSENSVDRSSILDQDYLIAEEAQGFSPVEGVTVTAWGIVDGQLHLQVYYEDILQYDNHGYVALKNSSGEEILPGVSVAFFDEDRVGSYEEYLFDLAPGTDLSHYTLWGHFWTCSTLTKGKWEVAFPIQNNDF